MAKIAFVTGPTLVILLSQADTGFTRLGKLMRTQKMLLAGFFEDMQRMGGGVVKALKEEFEHKNLEGVVNILTTSL